MTTRGIANTVKIRSVSPDGPRGQPWLCSHRQSPAYDVERAQSPVVSESGQLKSEEVRRHRNAESEGRMNRLETWLDGPVLIRAMSPA
jgi:hypothetical protein